MQGRWGEVHTPGQDLMLEPGGGACGGDHVAWGSAIGRSLRLGHKKVGQLGRGAQSYQRHTESWGSVKPSSHHHCLPAEALLSWLPMPACAEPRDHQSAPEPPETSRTGRGKELSQRSPGSPSAPQAGRLQGGDRSGPSCSETPQAGSPGCCPELQSSRDRIWDSGSKRAFRDPSQHP